MLFLYDLISFITYHFILMSFMVLAIITARKKVLSWILYFAGAIIHLLSLIGNTRTAYLLPFDISIYWATYCSILFFTFLLMLIRMSKSITNKDTANTQIVDKETSSFDIENSNDNFGYSKPIKFSFVWLSAAILFIIAELLITIYSYGFSFWSFVFCLNVVVAYLFCEIFKKHTLPIAIISSALTILSFNFSTQEINLIAEYDYSYYSNLFDINTFCYIAYWTACGLIQLFRLPKLIESIKQKKKERKEKNNKRKEHNIETKNKKEKLSKERIIITIIWSVLFIIFFLVSLALSIDCSFFEISFWTLFFAYTSAAILYFIYRITNVKTVIIPLIAFSTNVIALIINIFIGISDVLTDYYVYSVISFIYFVILLCIHLIENRQRLLSKYHNSLNYKMRCLRKVEKLELLKEKGIITEEEFLIRKNDIINK